MIKILQKIVLGSAVVLATSFMANAQTEYTIIDEHFNTGNFDGEHGYVAGNAPSEITDAGTGSGGGPTSGTSCDPAGGANPDPTQIEVASPNNYDVVGADGITFTLNNAASTGDCDHKSHGGSNVCESNAFVAHGSTGYVHLSKTGGSLTTGTLQDVTTVDITYSATGSGDRNAVLQKSTDGGTTWVDVKSMIPSVDAEPTAANCGQYGLAYNNIAVNQTGAVQLRITVYAADPEVIRIHDLVVRSTTPLSVQKSSWAESGISMLTESNTLTLKSETHSGSVNIVSLTGKVMAEEEIQRGGQSSFVMPSGLYIVRFISEDKVYTKKVVIN